MADDATRAGADATPPAGDAAHSAGDATHSTGDAPNEATDGVDQSGLEPSARSRESEPVLDRRTTRLATLGLAALGGVVAWVVAHRVFPYHSLNHDEAVYLQQAAMLLEGQLSIYPPVEDVFRPWFFVEDGDRLYPKYSPVPSAVFALGGLAGGYRLALAAVAAGNVALVSGTVAEAFDRRTGLLAALVFMCSPFFVLQSGVFLSYAPTTFLNLAFAGAYLRADRTASRPWAAVAGAAVGLAFFSRPYTAVLFAMPFVAHALWTLRGLRSAVRDPRGFRRAVRERPSELPEPLGRQLTTAAFGLAGVGVTLGYNAAVTGSAFLFPYLAFAPEDGLGFGHHEILAHEVNYTPELALAANGRVLALFATDWFTGGLWGVGFALAGLGVAVYRGLDARQVALAGVAATVVAGNVFFWGNYNVLGALEEPGDGLVNVLGPYYHFDLLVPTAAFAAVGALAAVDGCRRVARGRLPGRAPGVAVALLVVLATAGVGGVTAADLNHRVEENMEPTRTFERVYEPFEGGGPANAVVLVPRPYGPWLNHPFQALRNGAGFDGRTVYALEGRPFAVADAFPNRTLYRFGYRGVWAPWDGSPRGERLQRVRDVTGERVRLAATVGVPETAVGVTVRVATASGSTYHVPRRYSKSLSLNVTVTPERARTTVNGRRVDPTSRLDGRETVRVTVFVDYGPRGGFTYRVALPVRVDSGEVRALSPVVRRCRGARVCDDGATHVPELAPEGVFVRQSLDPNVTTKGEPS